MPDKPAQHGPRTWFEEPPRPEHATRTGDGAADQESSTQLPGSGVENSGNGNVAAPARPAAAGEDHEDHQDHQAAAESVNTAGTEQTTPGVEDTSADAGTDTPDAQTEPSGDVEPTAPIAVGSSGSGPGSGGSESEAAGTPAARQSSQGPAADDRSAESDEPGDSRESGEPTESDDAETDRLAVPAGPPGAGNEQPVAETEPPPGDPEPAAPAAAQDPDQDPTVPGVAQPAASAQGQKQQAQAQAQEQKEQDQEQAGKEQTQQRAPTSGEVPAPAPVDQPTSRDGASPQDSPRPDRSPRGVPDDAVTAVIPVIPGPASYTEPVTPPRAPQPPPRFDTATTAEIPRVEHVPSHAPSGWPTRDMTQQPMPDSQPRPGGPGGRPPGGATPPGDRPPFLRRGGIVAAVVLGLLLLGYVVDVTASRGEVPRGVTVAGVDIGGLERAVAEQRLREQLEPRLTRPLTLLAGDANVTLDPDEAGLSLDWPATLDEAGEQPLNPWTRFVSLFANREVGVVTTGDQAEVTAALEELRSTIDRESIEGTIRFEGAEPIPVDPIPGQRLDLPAAVDVLLAEWIHGDRVQLPVDTLEVSTTSEGIREALTEFVEPAVSDGVTVDGDGVEAVLEPRTIAESLRFAPNDEGGLSVTVDHEVVIEALRSRLAETEKEARDASIEIQGGRPVVQPSAQGRSIDWEESLSTLPEVLRASGGQRSLSAVYTTESPDLTTEEARQLGIETQISTFTTSGFASDSGENIRRAAEQVNGAIVRPGETFSLNGHTGPRTAASGYTEAGIIENGRPARGIGGGVSQFATTLFNASYFAGMVDVEHREHSYYISRYPMGREATVYEGAIDVKFRNDSPTGVLIQTEWTPSDVTVTFWGTKHVEVESITGERTDFTDPPTRRISDEDCISTQGSPGFTVTDTRVVRDAGTGAEISRNSHTVVYNPQPKIVCE